MTSHHDVIKINFLRSLGDTWRATPGPRKHPSSPRRRDSRSLSLSSFLVAIFSKVPGPSRVIVTVHIKIQRLTFSPSFLRRWPPPILEVPSFKLPPPARIDRSIGRSRTPFLLQSRPVLTPITPRSSKSNVGKACGTNSLSKPIFHRGGGVQIARSSSYRRAFVAGRGDFVRGGLGGAGFGAGFGARLEPPSSSSPLFSWSAQLRNSRGICVGKRVGGLGRTSQSLVEFCGI